MIKLRCNLYNIHLYNKGQSMCLCVCVFAIERKITSAIKKLRIRSYVEFSQKDDRQGFISKFQIVFEKFIFK